MAVTPAPPAAMVLCAGLGSRLRPLTDWCAKPLVPVGDRSVLAHILERLRAAGVQRIAVNTHHRAADVRAALSPDVAISEEHELLGTAGGLTRALPSLGDGDVVVWNGDILADVDLPALLAAHAELSADATLVVAPSTGVGNVGLDADGNVVRLRRETARPGEVRSANFVPVHVVGASLRSELPERGDFVSDVYLPAIRRGARVRTIAHDRPWFDVGSLAVYLAANRAWLGARASWQAPDARVSADIDGSVVGAGAVVEAPASDCVVWPGAHVTEPLERSVVTPFGVVRST